MYIERPCQKEGSKEEREMGERGRRREGGEEERREGWREGKGERTLSVVTEIKFRELSSGEKEWIWGPTTSTYHKNTRLFSWFIFHCKES